LNRLEFPTPFPDLYAGWRSSLSLLTSAATSVGIAAPKALGPNTPTILHSINPFCILSKNPPVPRRRRANSIARACTCTHGTVRRGLSAAEPPPLALPNKALQATPVKYISIIFSPAGVLVYSVAEETTVDNVLNGCPLLDSIATKGHKANKRLESPAPPKPGRATDYSPPDLSVGCSSPNKSRQGRKEFVPKAGV
jgi:hypothetical protein